MFVKIIEICGIFHQQSVHKHTKITPVDSMQKAACIICKKTFQDQLTLSSHLLTAHTSLTGKKKKMLWKFYSSAIIVRLQALHIMFLAASIGTMHAA